MKNLLSKALGLALVTLLVVTCSRGINSSNKDVYSRVVKLSSPHGMCSGEGVNGASGTPYILTAAHCKVLSEDGQSIKVSTADGRELSRRIVQIDPHSDLMLLEGIPGMRGLTIADHSSPRDKVETFTHGHDYPTYETDGVLIANVDIKFIIGLIDSPEAEARCSGGTLSIETIQTLFGDVRACVFSAKETATTALIVPGSSGGAAVNEDHELVGVASACGDSFGFLVRLEDIKAFLANY